MPKYVVCLFVCLALSIPLRLSAQEAARELWLENLEQLLMDNESRLPDEDELEALSFGRHHPLDLNAATRHQLEQFPFLSDRQIENLLAYLYRHGPMKSLHELQLVEGMDRRTLALLQPFVCLTGAAADSVGPTAAVRRTNIGSEVMARLDVPFYRRQGYDHRYLGTPVYHSLRATLRCTRRLQAGFAGEKDAGEPWFALHDRRGYDHYAYYVLLNDWGRLQTLVAGTYRLDYGQGLVLGNGFGTGKSFSTATLRRREKGIGKFGSTDEYRYFRGVAVAVTPADRWRLSAFYSHRRMDGTVEDGQLVSLYRTGLHRTADEAAKRHTFALQMTGANLTYTSRQSTGQLGLTGIYYFFDRPYRPQLRTYARYNLQGNRFYNVGLNYRYRLGRLALAGEAAKGKQGLATVNHLEYTIAPSCRLWLTHRYYSHNYWALFAQSFAEGTSVQNENGWYVAAEAEPLAGWRFFASLDFFSFQWWKYRISKPSKGWEARAQAAWTPTDGFSSTVNYRYKRKERDLTGSGGQVVLPTHQHRLRWRADCRAGASWRFCTTVDYNLFRSQERAQGWQCTQLAGYAVAGFPLSLSVQGTYFHTDNYDSRVYVYEPGLLYSFYSPSFSGRGFRCSARVNCTVGAFTLTAKLGQTVYADRNEIGSGNDLIAGNKKMDLQMQLRVKF